MPWPKGKPRPPEVSRKAAETRLAATADDRATTRAAIIRVLEGSGGFNEHQLMIATSCSRRSVNAALADLAKEQIVEHVGHPYRYYLKETI